MTVNLDPFGGLHELDSAHLLGGFRANEIQQSVYARTGRVTAPVLWASPELLILGLEERVPWRVGERLWFDIGTPTTQVRDVLGSVQRLDDSQSSPLAAIHLLPESEEKARRLLRMLFALVGEESLTLPTTEIAADERIRDEATIRAAVLSLRATKAHGHLIGDKQEQAPQLQIRDIERGPYPIVWEYSGTLTPPTTPFIIEAVGYNSIYQLPINRFVIASPHLKTEMPRWIRRLRHRSQRRALVRRELTAAFVHPNWKRLITDAALQDISMRGFSINADPEALLLYPGLLVPNLQIMARDELLVRGTARIRSISLSNPPHIGFEFEHRDEAMLGNWERLVSDLLNPHTHPGYRFLDGTWNTYQASGYFSLSGKSPKHFKRLRRAFYKASQRLATAPNLSSHAVWSTNGDISATISMAKTHDHTWLVYQLARAPGNAEAVPGGSVLRELYFRCYEDAQRDPDLRWLLAYVQTSAHWSRVIHYDWVRDVELADARLAHTHRFRALEIDTKMPRYVHVPEVSTTSAKTADSRLIQDAAVRKYGPVWADALDLVHPRTTSPNASKSYRTAGLEKSREIFIARIRGRAIAYMVCDSTSEGIHLFGLMDTARLIPCENTEVPPAVVHSLVHSATQWFSEQKKHIYVFLDDHDYLDAETSAFIEDMGLADQTILAADAIPDMLEYVQSKTHPREWTRLLEEKHG